MKKNYYFRLAISLTSVFIVTIAGLLIYGKLGIINDKYVSIYANDKNNIDVKDLFSKYNGKFKVSFKIEFNCLL